MIGTTKIAIAKIQVGNILTRDSGELLVVMEVILNHPVHGKPGIASGSNEWIPIEELRGVIVTPNILEQLGFQFDGYEDTDDIEVPESEQLPIEMYEPWMFDIEEGEDSIYEHYSIQPQTKAHKYYVTYNSYNYCTLASEFVHDHGMFSVNCLFLHELQNAYLWLTDELLRVDLIKDYE